MSGGAWMGAGIAVLIICGDRQGTRGAEVPHARPLEHVSAAYRGTGACSAIACHGSASPSRAGQVILRNEHSTWAARDKHASAYQVLFTERSNAMAHALGLGNAHESARCLTCHTMPAANASATAWEREGVSCESCHGPAERWLGPHTAVGWRHLTPREKEDGFGLFATKDVARRAAVCATCHVGEPAEDGRLARDVSHDLIAAGHPALRFEFTAYLDLMPAHWIEKGPNAAPDFPARAWAVGRVASAKAAADLLAERARHANAAAPAQRGPWPEFAEYSCFSCHRPIGVAGHSGAARSTTAWGTWYHTAGADRPSTLGSDLEALQRLMEQAAPDPDAVAQSASRMSVAYARWLDANRDVPLDAGAIRALAASVSPARSDDWDQEAQAYLAAVALRQALLPLDPREADRNRTRERLVRWRDELRFPMGLDRPRRLERPESGG